MLRAALYAILSVIAITFLRIVIGLITRGIGDAMKDEPRAGSPKPSAQAPTRGEFKACAACGTYVLAASAIREGDAWFCSDACRQKRAGAAGA